MRLLRFVKRAVLAIVLIAIIFVVGLSVYLRIEQYKFRRLAEHLLSDVRELELTKASASQVKVVMMRWGFKEWGEEPDHPGHPCTEDNCLYRFELVPSTRQGHLADPFLSALEAHPLEPLLFPFAGFYIHIRNLLEARMVIAPYNNRFCARI